MHSLLATINWTAAGVIVGALTGPLAWAAKFVGRKIDQIGEHLAQQDVRGNRMDRRMMRVEMKLGMDPLRRNDD